jgi:hypothetical protein
MRCEKAFLLVRKHWLPDNGGVLEELQKGPISAWSAFLQLIEMGIMKMLYIIMHAYAPKDKL